MAGDAGFSLDDLVKCEVRGINLDCPSLFELPVNRESDGYMGVYNPNLDEINGFFIRTPKGKDLQVEIVRPDQ